MKFALLALTLISVQAFAAGPYPPQLPKTCVASLIQNAKQVKSAAKDVVHAGEDALDESLDEDGTPTVGMGLRDRVHGAQDILDGVRALQENGDPLSENSVSVLKCVCASKLQIDACIE